MFAYKLLLSTLDALYIDTSLVSWFHLYLLLRQTKNGIAYNLQLHLATFQASLDSNPGDARGNGYWVDLIIFFLDFSAPNLTLLSKFPIPERELESILVSPLLTSPRKSCFSTSTSHVLSDLVKCCLL